MRQINIEKFAEMTISTIFPVSDLGMFENNDIEFFKLLYSTIIKVENLVLFLNSKDEYKDLKISLLKSFNVITEHDFLQQLKYFFAKLLQLKVYNNYIFVVDDEQSKNFLKSIVAENIAIDEDFTYLKNLPLYQLDQNTFSIIDYFFAVDKFYKSVKFKLKDIYKDLGLIERYGNFFSFYNLKFSEQYLMKNVLNDLFDKKYFFKNIPKEIEVNGEPDYYIRHGSKVYIFENKDNLVSKEVKASGNINEIDKMLRRNLVDGKGVGQLVSRIEEIVNGKFKFDNYVNGKKVEVYPIILVHDRIFETPGINYKLNQWYINLVKERLGDLYSNEIKNLILIDIDTLIYWLPYLKINDKNFLNFINNHINKMSQPISANNVKGKEGLRLINKKLTDKISPISTRLPQYKFPMRIFIEKFKDVIKD